MNEFLIPTKFSLKNKEHIHLLQQGLIALKYPIDNAEVKERIYAESTKEALSTFQKEYCLALNYNVSLETINAINAELDKLYRLCGYLTNDYGMAIEGVYYDIRRIYFDGGTSSIGNGITLSDGSFRSYIDISKEYSQLPSPLSSTKTSKTTSTKTKTATK